MKVGLGYRGRMRGDLGPAGQEIDLTHQALTAWREGEHNIDGGHTDVTADTLIVDGATEFGGPWTKPEAAVVTPPDITADQNDYRPRFLETAIWLRLTTDASRTITGIHRSLETGLDAFRWLCIANVGNFDIVLSHNDVLSQSRNRFGCPGGVDLTIQTSECVWLWYDNSSANWRVVAGSGSASGASGSVGGVVADGDYGDITVSGVGTVFTIDADVVTFAKMQNITSDRLLGRDTAASGNTEEISVGGGIEFTGSTSIQTSALTGDVTKTAGGTALTASTALKTRQVTFVLDGDGSDIATGQKYAYTTVPYSGTITAWRIVSPDTDDIVIDVLKGTYAGFPTVATITGGSEPELVNANKDEDSVSWAVTAGDILDVDVLSCSGITRCILTLTVVLS